MGGRMRYEEAIKLWAARRSMIKKTYIPYVCRWKHHPRITVFHNKCIHLPQLQR